MRYCIGPEIKKEVIKMGIWGSEFYKNDTFLDVKDQFESLFQKGKTVQEITEQLLEEFECLLGDSEEEPVFWFALADIQWRFGVLMPNVKEKAFFWIEKIKSTERMTKQELSEILKRKELEDLKKKLLSPQPPAKKPVRKRLYKCEWKIGDVFAYRLEGELATERGLLGRYFLIRKVDEGSWYPGHIVPIVHVKLTVDGALPTNVEEYDRLEYVQTSFSKYEERFWPIDGRRPQEDIAEKSKLKYEVDEFGFLPQFRVRLLQTSKKSIPSKLIYLGNFSNILYPQKEFIPHSKDNIMVVAWQGPGETFETKMIKRYCGHNLRELSVYRKS